MEGAVPPTLNDLKESIEAWPEGSEMETLLVPDEAVGAEN
jgi:hypothetical protein